MILCGVYEAYGDSSEISKTYISHTTERRFPNRCKQTASCPEIFFNADTSCGIKNVPAFSVFLFFPTLVNLLKMRYNE